MESDSKIKRTKKIILFSGGIDSSYLIHSELNKEHTIIGLYCVYNHPALKEELEATDRLEKVWKDAGHDFHLLYQKTEMVADQMFIGTQEEGPRIVPNRNAIMLMHAVNLAASVGATEVLFGAVLDDSSEYIDCRKSFIDKINIISSLYDVQISAPLINHLKRNIEIPEYIRELSWSCYEPFKNKQCGRCSSCLSNACPGEKDV